MGYSLESLRRSLGQKQNPSILGRMCGFTGENLKISLLNSLEQRIQALYGSRGQRCKKGVKRKPGSFHLVPG
jgi:hypothetical protein